MKQLFFAAAAGMLCFVTSCDSNNSVATTGKHTAQEQRNLAASDVIVKAFQTGDVSGIDSVVAVDLLDHSDKGDIKGRDSLKSMVKMMHENFRDMKMEKVHEVGDDDHVYTWMHYSGTSDGAMGMPKGPYNFNVIELSRFKDGKAVEHWAFMNMQDMMKMMPPPPPPKMNDKDTVKMKK